MLRNISALSGHFWTYVTHLTLVQIYASYSSVSLALVILSQNGIMSQKARHETSLCKSSDFRGGGDRKEIIMGWKPIHFGLAGMMLIFGSFNTLSVKWADTMKR